MIKIIASNHRTHQTLGNKSYLIVNYNSAPFIGIDLVN